MIETQQLQINYLQSGGLIANYYCSSACAHCLYRCSPKWPKDYIEPETALKNFDTIRRLGCRSVHIGGGEPLLRPDALERILEIASEAGIVVEYVETNSSWFRNEQKACSILEQLTQKGLGTLLVSISPFHNEFIPFYKVKGVIEACRRSGVSIFPWVSGFVDDLNVFDERQTHSLKEYEERFGPHYIESLLQRYWISPGGRALETFGKCSPAKPAAQVVQENRRGCAELAEVGHFHLDLYGNYVPGLCSGLSIHRDDLGNALDPDEYPIISRLYSGGIAEFIEYAAELYDYTPPRDGYSSKCALCHDARRFLVTERQLNSKELQPQGHYVHG